MKTQEELTLIVAKNIATYRKKLGLTQLQLAELLSYSDKAVSKWERAEALPDIFVLSKIAEIFKITVNDLLEETNEKKLDDFNLGLKEELKTKNRNRIVISILSFALVWFVATICFSIIEMINSEFYPWLSFIYAIPLSMIVLLIFSKIWGKRWMRFIIISCLGWSIALCFQISIDTFASINNSYLFYIIAAGFQILTLFWYLKRRNK